MALWDSIRGRSKDDPTGGLKPIVQRVPLPVTPPRLSQAKPAPKLAVSRVEPLAVSRVESPAAPPPQAAPQKKETPKAQASKAPKVEPAVPAGRGPELAVLQQAVVRQARGDHEGAVAGFTQVLALDPFCVEAWAGRAISREQLGDLAGARADYARSIEIEVRAEIARQAKNIAS